MLRWFTVFCLATVHASELPFWKAKEKVYRRVQGGEIIVSVKSGPSTAHARRLLIAGGGQTRAPCDFVFAFARDFDQVARLSGFIDKAVYDSGAGLIDATLSAFGHRADVRVLAKALEGTPPCIDFEIVKGPMLGLRSRIEFVTAGSVKCDVGIAGEYEYDKFPIPRIFLEFGLEVVFQKMAMRLRQQAEAAYKRGKE